MNFHVIDSFDQRNVVNDFVVHLGLHDNCHHEFTWEMIIQVINDAVESPWCLVIQINHDFNISKSNKEVTDYYSTLLSTINFLARLQPSDVKTPFREAVTEEYCSVTVVWLIF